MTPDQITEKLLEYNFITTLVFMLRWPVCVFLISIVLAIRLPKSGIGLIKKILICVWFLVLGLVRLMPSQRVKEKIDSMIVKWK